MCVSSLCYELILLNSVNYAGKMQRDKCAKNGQIMLFNRNDRLNVHVTSAIRNFGAGNTTLVNFLQSL